MKTNIFSITALALMITTSFIAGRNTLENRRLELPGETITEVIDMNSNSYIMTEAKVVNGEVIPIVNLPELTIEADYSKENLVKAKLVDGEIIAVVDLPELTIVAN